jgi:flagellar biosynthetic protein FlhB
MPEEDKHSRTEKPTARRKKAARREGTVARTPEVVTWSVVFIGTYVVKHTVGATYALMQRLWFQISTAMAHPSLDTDFSVARSAAGGAIAAAAPGLLAIMGLALLINLGQTRGLVTLHPLKPNFTKLNPKTGFKRIVNPRSLWEVGKQVVRMALLALVVFETMSSLLPAITGSGPLSSTAVASLVASRAISLTRDVAAISLVLAAMDYVIQYRKVASQLRMTKYEVKEETKSSEGNPLMKRQIRRRQRQMARNSMITAVARADAIVVNPTHFAVAISYVRGRGAPKVVAKGTDFLAQRIREEAAIHRVPVVVDPPLARALYVACDLEREIPNELYEAVARLLTFIYGLKASGRLSPIDGGPLRPTSPLLTGAAALLGEEALAAAGARAGGARAPRADPGRWIN